MRISNILVLLGGIFLLGVGIWTFENKTFTDDLLRNSLYLDTAKVLTVVGCLTILVSFFGFFALHKEVKVLLITYFSLNSLVILVLAIGAVLAYVFREQVDLTMKAEMVSDIRNYDPGQPTSPTTWAWDSTQEQLECCGMMTQQVNQSYEVWRYSRALNPEEEGVWQVPHSCCIPNMDCGRFMENISNIYTKDCYTQAKLFVVGHAEVMGGVAVVISCILLLGDLASLMLFRSIV